jgi:hypothetical protein
MRSVLPLTPVRVSGPEVGTLQGSAWHLNVPVGGVEAI